jgi:hypothetical protein
MKESDESNLNLLEIRKKTEKCDAKCGHVMYVELQSVMTGLYTLYMMEVCFFVPRASVGK